MGDIPQANNTDNRAHCTVFCTQSRTALLQNPQLNGISKRFKFEPHPLIFEVESRHSTVPTPQRNKFDQIECYETWPKLSTVQLSRHGHASHSRFSLQIPFSIWMLTRSDVIRRRGLAFNLTTAIGPERSFLCIFDCPTSWDWPRIGQ